MNPPGYLHPSLVDASRILRHVRICKSIWSAVTGRIDPGAWVRVAKPDAIWLEEHGFVAFSMSMDGDVSEPIDLSAEAYLLQDWNAGPGDSFMHATTGLIRKLPLPSELMPLEVTVRESRDEDFELGRVNTRVEFSLGPPTARPDPRALDALRQAHERGHLLARMRAWHRRFEDRLCETPEYDRAMRVLQPAFTASERCGPRGAVLKADADTIERALDALPELWERGLRRLEKRAKKSAASAAGVASGPARKEKNADQNAKIVALYREYEQRHGGYYRGIRGDVAALFRVSPTHVKNLITEDDQRDKQN